VGISGFETYAENLFGISNAALAALLGVVMAGLVALRRLFGKRE
jgi:hypothetical protein